MNKQKPVRGVAERRRFEREGGGPLGALSGGDQGQQDTQGGVPGVTGPWTAAGLYSPSLS